MQTTARGQLPDLITRRDREYLYEGTTAEGVLTVQGPRENSVYLVEEIQGEPGRYLLANQTSTDADIYCVDVDSETCTCWGFRRWGKACKHLSSILGIFG